MPLHIKEFNFLSFVKRSPLSPKELAARRGNARKSTGPRTAEGKARVSLNRLLHGGRSAHFKAFLRQIGANERAFFAVCKSARLPGEPVGIVQAAVVNLWLKSPRSGGFPRKAVALVGRPPAEHCQPGTVESLLSTKKRASVLKALTPDYRRVLAATIFADVGRATAGEAIEAPRPG